MTFVIIFRIKLLLIMISALVARSMAALGKRVAAGGGMLTDQVTRCLFFDVLWMGREEAIQEPDVDI